MSAVTARTERAAGARVGSRRLAAALPVVALFVAFAALYAWEGWRQRSPWIFFDEVFYTHDAQSVLGHASATLDSSSPRETLYALLIAPAWLFDDSSKAYATAKLIGALTMSAAVFPAYALARTVVPRNFALFAAAATGSIPALFYSSTIMEEVLAYPYATLTLFLIAKALGERSRGWIAGAVVASVLAPLVRGELALLPVVFALAAVLLFGAERWEGWSPGRRVGAVAAAVAIAAIGAAVIYSVSSEARAAASHPHLFVDRALWTAAAFTIGIGFLPVIAGLASVVRPAGEEATAAGRALSCLLLSAVAVFVLYAGGKGATAAWINPVLERNVIYAAPVLFAGTALLLARARASLFALVAATALTLAVVLTLPVRLHNYPAAEAPALAILAAARTSFDWGMRELRFGFAVGAALAVGLIVLLLAVRDSARARLAVTVAIAVSVIGWSVTSEVYASNAGIDYSRVLMATIPKPHDWVERATGGSPAAYIGQSTGRPDDVWLLAFWNPSLQQYLRLDEPPPHTAFVRVAVAGSDGRLAADPRLRYLLADQGIRPTGRPVASRAGLTLYHVARPAVTSTLVGRYGDGWIGRSARYDHYGAARPGTLVVSYSRGTVCGPATPAATLTVRVAPLRTGPLRPGHTIAHASRSLRPCGEHVISLRTPSGPFRATIGASSTFVPAAVDPHSADTRGLGALVTVAFRQRR